MGSIGSDLFYGMLDAAGKLIMAVPFMIWIVIAVGLVGFGILMRYLTNIKVDLVIFVLFILVNGILVYRQHWIDQGYAEAQAQVTAAKEEAAGYKVTEYLIIGCYSSPGFVWDRTVGKCLSVDGSQ